MEVLIDGLITTVIGMGTVFFVLILLYLILLGMRFIFYNKQCSAENIKDTKIQQEEINDGDDIIEYDEEQLISVLTAAVAASLNTSTYNLKIKSYKRIGQHSPVWNISGRERQLNNRKNICIR